MQAPSLRQLFFGLTLAFVGLLAATALQAWTGPTAAPPAGNVPAPVNVGSVNQVKDAGLSLNSLAVFGSQYIQEKLGIGRLSPVVALDVNGSIRMADGGELCQSVSEGAQRYNDTTNVMEYCDGTNWIPWGTGGGGGGGGASSIISGFPDAILCANIAGTGNWILYNTGYTALAPNRLIYAVGLSTTLWIQIDVLTSKIASFGGGWTSANCAVGATVSSLYSSGQAFNFVGSFAP